MQNAKQKTAKATKFKIKDALAACDIGTWCNDKFRPNGWELNTTNLFSNNLQYEFAIKDRHNALLFAITWAEYA